MAETRQPIPEDTCWRSTNGLQGFNIGADAESGLVHHGTAANVADVTEVAHLLHGDETVICADAGYTGVEKRPEHEGRSVTWQIAARRSTYKRGVSLATP